MAKTAVETKRSAGAERCRRKFLRYFPKGFRDPKYVDWERGYKWTAHEAWGDALGPDELARLLAAGEHTEVASRAVRIESRTNLLFSFEKMALRDAVKAEGGAKLFAEGLFALLHGRGGARLRFERWIEVVDSLPRRQTRVLTWPLVTVFGFIARPREHIFLKPNVTRRAAREYGFDLAYRSRPGWEIYEGLIAFAARIAEDNRDLAPRDMIDLQSFMWVMGSDEYP